MCDKSAFGPLETEVKELKIVNNELVQQVQFWKVTAGQRENEKLELLKENNELRLKLSRMRCSSIMQSRTLRTFDAAQQLASKEALTHLVEASNAVTKSIQLTQEYISMKEKYERASSPKWNSTGSPQSPHKDRVHRVPPMLIGGQSIQPVVSLNRVMLNNSLPARNVNVNRSVPERIPLPLHILQDVSIPLRRMDMSQFMEQSTDADEDLDDTGEEDNLLNENADIPMEESQNVPDEFESPQPLAVVFEESEGGDESGRTSRNQRDNPLEGPSWLLDYPSRHLPRRSALRVNLEPDSTTEGEEARHMTPPERASSHLQTAPAASPRETAIAGPSTRRNDAENADAPAADEPARSFSPTVRRRKRSPPPPSPILPTRIPPARNGQPPPNCHNSNRELKVVVSKIKIEQLEAIEGCDVTPPKRSMRFDAPSPNGATGTAGVVMEQSLERAATNSRQSRRFKTSTATALDSDSGGDTSSEGRSRRPKKQVVYKEKPLNRKLRR